MSHNSVTPCNPAGVSTVCTAVLLCVVTFCLLHHQTAAEEIQCAPACRCYGNIANCSNRGVGFVPHWDRFSVGLLVLDLTGNRIDSLDKGELIGYVTVRNVSFRNNTIQKVHPFAFLGLANSLVYLDLSSNTIHTIDSTTFKLVPKLEVLLISNNSIAFLESTVFSALKELRQLDLSLNHLSQIADGTFEGNSQLQFLSLRHNGIDSIGEMTFIAQQNLRHLDLSHNKISVIVQGAFLALQQLEWLSLAQNYIKEVSTNLFGSTRHVLHLNMSANAIDCIKPLSFANCSRLQTLSIAHNNVSEVRQEALYGLFNLTHLDLSHNKLTHFGPEVFVAPQMSVSAIRPTEPHHNNTVCPQFQSLYRHLESLKLNNNQISSLEPCVFAPVSSLQVVDVSANNLSALDRRIFRPLENVSSFDISWNSLSTVDVGTAQWLLDSATGTAVSWTGKCCVYVFSVQLLISCRLYTDCCAHVADNPWHCDCDGMYTVYRTFREESGQNVTLLCKSPANLMGKSWDVLEEKCQPTVTPPPQSTVTESTANTTAVSTSQSVQFSPTVQQNVALQDSCPDDSYLPSANLVMYLTVFSVAAYCCVVVLIVTTRKWWMNSGNDRDRTQQVGTAEFSALGPGFSGVQFSAT